MPPVGFEPTISAGERPQTHALDRAATGTGKIDLLLLAALDGNYEIIIVLHLLDVNQESDTRCCLSAKFGAAIFLGGLVNNGLFVAVAVT